jgi:hypothetical protein
MHHASGCWVKIARLRMVAACFCASVVRGTGGPWIGFEKRDSRPHGNGMAHLAALHQPFRPWR